MMLLSITIFCIPLVIAPPPINLDELEAFTQFSTSNDLDALQTLSNQLSVSNQNENSRYNDMKFNGGIVLTQQSNLESLKGRLETTIAQGIGEKIIFVAFNSAQGFCGLGTNETNCTPSGVRNGLSAYTVSLDGGKTWSYQYSPPNLNNDGVYTAGDPWLSIGGKQRKYAKHEKQLLYLVSLAVNETTINSIGLVVHIASIHSNKRRYYKPSYSWIRESVIPQEGENDFLSASAIISDPFNSNIAYVSLASYRENIANPFWPQIEVFSTFDAGITWNGPTIIEPAANNIVYQMTYPSVGASGQVYITYFEEDRTSTSSRVNLYKIKFAVSGDQGVTFSNPIQINPHNTMFNPIYQPPVSFNRAILFPRATMDVILNGQYKNRIIVTFSYSLKAFDFDNDFDTLNEFIDDDHTMLNSLQIGVLISDDQGETWLFIDDLFKNDIPDTLVKRIFPSISVSSNGKYVNIVYLEVREVKKETLCDPSGGGRTSFYHDIVDTYYIHSCDGGMTWTDPIKVNRKSVDWCTTFTHVRPNYGDHMLSISKRNGAPRIAGVTNGFTPAPTSFNDFTVVDVIFYGPKHCKAKCVYKRGKQYKYKWSTSKKYDAQSVAINDILGVTENVSNTDTFDYNKYTFFILLVLIMLTGMELLYYFYTKPILNENKINSK